MGGAAIRPMIAITTRNVRKMPIARRPSAPNIRAPSLDPSVATSSDITSGTTVIRSPFTHIVPTGSIFSLRARPKGEPVAAMMPPTTNPSPSPMSARIGAAGIFIGGRPSIDALLDLPDHADRLSLAHPRRCHHVQHDAVHRRAHLG